VIPNLTINKCILFIYMYSKYHNYHNIPPVIYLFKEFKESKESKNFTDQNIIEMYNMENTCVLYGYIALIIGINNCVSCMYDFIYLES